MKSHVSPNLIGCFQEEAQGRPSLYLLLTELHGTFLPNDFTSFIFSLSAELNFQTLCFPAAPTSPSSLTSGSLGKQGAGQWTQPLERKPGEQAVWILSVQDGEAMAVRGEGQQDHR